MDYDMKSLLGYFESLLLRQHRVESKIDELLLSTQFIRRHMATYVGNGRALTYLDDETPIYVNSNDFGPPANFINGGEYERDNLDTLYSLVRDDTVFLDIGANLGFFSLKIGRRVFGQGVVHAFEPHPELVQLARGSVHLNGLGSLAASDGCIRIHHIALGEETGEVSFAYPEGHLGGGGRSPGDLPQHTIVRAQICRLDNFFPPDFKIDLVKIDVEGHELSVLRGMRATLARSPTPKILFEKFGTGRGDEPAMEAELRRVGLTIYGVLPGARLQEIAEGGLSEFSGNALACPRSLIGDRLKRRFFTIFPRQFFVLPELSVERSRDILAAAGERGSLLFYGPYWLLPSGTYHIHVDADVTGSISIDLAHRFGHIFKSIEISGNQRDFDIVVDRDLVQFECIARSSSSEASIRLRGISFEVVG